MKIVYGINKALISQYIPNQTFLVSIWTMKGSIFFPEFTFMEMFFIMFISSQWMTVQRLK